MDLVCVDSVVDGRADVRLVLLVSVASATYAIRVGFTVIYSLLVFFFFLFGAFFCFFGRFSSLISFSIASNGDDSSKSSPVLFKSLSNPAVCNICFSSSNVSSGIVRELV